MTHSNWEDLPSFQRLEHLNKAVEWVRLQLWRSKRILATEEEFTIALCASLLVAPGSFRAVLTEFQFPLQQASWTKLCHHGIISESNYNSVLWLCWSKAILDGVERESFPQGKKCVLLLERWGRGCWAIKPSLLHRLGSKISLSWVFPVICLSLFLFVY